MKKRLALVLVLIFAFCLPVQTYAADEARIKIDGILFRGETTPVIIDGVTFMAATDILKLSGISKYDWNAAENSFSFAYGGSYYTFKTGSDVAVVLEKQIKLPGAPVLRDGKFMLPLKWACDLFGYKIAWDAQLKLVSITTRKTQYSLVEAHAIPSEATVLTHDEALEKAKTASTALKTINDSYEDLDDAIDEAQKSFDAAYERNNYAKYDKNYAEARRSLYALKEQRNALDYNKQQLIESLKLQLINYLTTSYKTNNQIATLKKNISLSEENVKNLELKLSLGLESALNVQNAKQSLDQSRINLENLNTKENNTQLELLQLMGYSSSQVGKIAVSYTPDAKTKPAEPNEHYEAQKLVAPKILLKEQPLRKAKFDLKTYQDLDSSITNKDEKEALDKVVTNEQRSFNDTLSAFEKSIILQYANLTQLNEVYQSLLIDYNKAKDSYDRTLVSYLLGQATIYQVKQAELGLYNAELSLNENRYDYALVLYSYLNPSMLN